MSLECNTLSLTLVTSYLQLWLLSELYACLSMNETGLFPLKKNILKKKKKKKQCPRQLKAVQGIPLYTYSIVF
jgi:hypothetical protein